MNYVVYSKGACSQHSPHTDENAIRRATVINSITGLNVTRHTHGHTEVYLTLSPSQSTPRLPPQLPMMLLPLQVLLLLQLLLLLLLLLHFRSLIHPAFQPLLAAQLDPCQPPSPPTPNPALPSPFQTVPPPVRLVHLASLPMQHPTSSLSAHPPLHFSQDSLKTQAAIFPLLSPHSLLPTNRKDQPANPQPRCYLFVYSSKT